MFKCGSSSSSSAKGIGASDLASAPVSSPGSTFIHPTDLTPHKPATTAGRRKGRLYSEDEQTSNSDGDSDSDDSDSDDNDDGSSLSAWEKLGKKAKEKAKKKKEKAKKKKDEKAKKKKQPKQSDDDDGGDAASEQQKKKSEEDAVAFVSPALPIPSGTHPEDAWPDEEVRAKLVSTQSFASVATNRVSDMGLAPSTYRIDLATDASEIAELQKEMNDGAIPALESAYQADSADVPRIHCKFPHPVFEYTADAVSHSFLNFELPLGDAATALDLHALQQQQESAENRGQVRMYLEPGSSEIACVPTATSQCVPSKNRTHHAVIISASARVTVNTTDSNFEIDLQVPNPARAKDRTAPLYVSCSEPIGITNNGAGKCHMFAPLFANTQTPTTASPGLDNVHRIDPHVFNSPEARRWSSIDADEAIAAVSKDSHSAIQRHYTDDSGNEIIVIDLTSTPTNIAEFVAVTHAKELNAAAAAINAERTHASLQRTKRGKSGLPQLPIPAYAPYSVAVPSGDALTTVVTPTLKPAVRVPLEAYARVIRHFCGLYSPSQFACNQQAMRLVLRPRGGEQQGMRSLYMNALRNKDKLAHVRVVLVVSQMPYEGRQELPKEARASFLADLQKDYADYMAIAEEINTNTVNISRLTPRASASSSAGGAIVPRTSRAPSDGQWRTATGKDALSTSVWDQPMVTSSTQPLMATTKSDLAFAAAAPASALAGMPARPIVDPRRYPPAAVRK